MTDSKTCYACQEEKPLSDFYRAARNKDGYAGLCKTCKSLEARIRYERTGEQQREYTREYRKNNPEKVRTTRKKHYDANRDRILREDKFRRYGLTPTELDELIVRHDGICPICDRPEKLYIDHDHVTGEVRGMLCNGCNLRLGWVDNVSLDKIAAYLQKD